MPRKYPRAYHSWVLPIWYPSVVTRRNDRDNKITMATIIQNITDWHQKNTIAAQEHNIGSKSVTPSSLKEAAIVMLNISSVDWEGSSEGLERKCHPLPVLVKPAHSMKFEDMACRQGNRDGHYTPHYMAYKSLWQNGQKPGKLVKIIKSISKHSISLLHCKNKAFCVWHSNEGYAI